MITDARAAFGLISRVEAGLPFSAADHIAKLIAPSDTRFKYRLVLKATYSRRKRANKLSPSEGARLVRIARVWIPTLAVGQSEAEARAFLFRTHPMLNDRRPIDLVIQSEIGAGLVLEALGRLIYGVAA
jgi:putative toxin-antitoxin system antitoxin component (TIGR02293 family)